MSWVVPLDRVSVAVNWLVCPIAVSIDVPPSAIELVVGAVELLWHAGADRSSRTTQARTSRTTQPRMNTLIGSGNAHCSLRRPRRRTPGARKGLGWATGVE